MNFNLNNLAPFRKNELFSVSREDGLTIGVMDATDDNDKFVSSLTKMLKDEHCNADILLTGYEYHKSNYTYDITYSVIEDGEEFEGYQVTIIPVFKY